MENFKALFDDLCLRRGLVLPASKISYLEGIKDPARRLWRAYRDNTIAIDYAAADTQMAYMIRYFPFYTQIIRSELNDLAVRGIDLTVLNSNPLNIALFCCGPAPEGHGITRYLKENGILDHSINMNVFDIFANQWRASRDTVFDHIRTHLLPRSIINVDEHPFDLRQPINLVHLDAVAPANLIVFQNCLNEINSAGRIVVEQSLLQILARIESGSIIAIIERWGYPLVLDFLNKLTTTFHENHCEILTRGITAPINIDNWRLRESILQTECSSLFTKWEDTPTGLIISKDVSYWSLIIRKL